MKIINDKEFKSVLRLPDQKRYAYFVKHAADSQMIWTLYGKDGWVLALSDQWHQLVPVWPFQRFAEACVQGNWAGTEARPIELLAWLERWTPGMVHDKRMVAVFPTPSNRGVAVTPERLKKDLDAELSLIE